MKYCLSLLLLFCSLTVFCQVDTSQQVVNGRVNSAAATQKPYVILISADGFRYDYARRYGAKHLQAFADSGIQAASMLPSYPSLTFPNHYTIVTGMYPSHHGLVANNFYERSSGKAYRYSDHDAAVDPWWYKGTPIWALSEQQKTMSAVYYWAASDVDISGYLPSYYYKYNEITPINKRISRVAQWLSLPEEKRPHLICFYIPDADKKGHTYGPNAVETQKAVQYVDSVVYELTKAVKATGIDANFIFLSDHGMAQVDNQHPMELTGIVDTAKFRIQGESTVIELYAKPGVNIKAEYKAIKQEAKGFKVYLENKIPARLKYNTANDRYKRIGDIVLIAEAPKVFSIRNGYVKPGQHGYDPYADKDMHATFYAWGPAFKRNFKVNTFKNIEVYHILTGILKLNLPAHAIDGDDKIARKILAN